MSKNIETDINNLKKALEKKEHSIERYSDQIKVFDDSSINSLLEGILHNEIIHKSEIEEAIKRLGG
ncbi:MAG: hypothetical protein ACE5KZ_11390 [Candidatus Scalinduaceae bacterium]